MRYKTEANGMCAQVATAVHVHEDEDETFKVKKRVNHHIADNWNHYKKFIPLPYMEVVGVGDSAKIVTKSTEQELLEFLRSDESLHVFSNHHELQATANLYNINIHVFTYSEDLERWTEIVPDPEMVAEVDAKVGKLI